MSISRESFPFGDGSTKIFGMENFGNTCYCNSILQCLYYTESFRKRLIQHKQTKHEPKLVVNGIRYHGFTAKYDQLLQKKLKDQGGVPITNSDERPKSSRKSSLFGLKFNNQANVSTTLIEQKNEYITEAGNCVSLPLEQRILISKSPEFSKLEMMITKPSINPVPKATNNGNISTINNNNNANNTDHSQSSSMLLNDQPLQTIQEGSINTKSSAIIVGIPKPETNLVTPINPFNNNPSSDQRKRSALINGPIINLDTALQLPSEQTEDTCLLYALKDLFESMVENKSTIGVVSPNHFITILKEKNYLFRQNNMHHDAHEFFNYLTNEIIESLNKELGEGQNWCNDIFQGLITNETKCLSCETITSKHENFIDLSIDVPPGESSYSLNFAINNFSKSETLTNQNKFHCNTCSSLQEAIKNIKVKKLPEVLVINLKRFKYDEQIDKMVKLFDSISYPFKLRLFNTTDDFNQNVLYDLYALVIHIGGGPMHGHYVSICKIKAGLWLLFDDETVELVDDNYVMRFFGNGPGLASAYILFYQKIEFDEKCEYFGFDPSTIYKGDDYSVQINETSRPPTTDSETKSEMSSINSFNPLEASTVGTQLNTLQPPKKPPLTTGGMFKSFKFEKPTSEDKPHQSLSRSSSNGAIPRKESEQPIKEKKSWVGSLKRTGLERKLSSKNTSSSLNSESVTSTASSNTTNGNSTAPLMPPQQPPPPLEKRKSLFGFKKKN